MITLYNTIVRFVPDWVYGKKYILGLIMAMAIGRIWKRINKIEKVARKRGYRI